jgi:hypothetical protein
MAVLFEFLVKVVLVGMIVLAVATVAAVVWGLWLGFIRRIGRAKRFKGKRDSE